MNNIGFIGLGIMGRAMAKNIIKQGYAVSLYNRTPGRDEELLEEGALTLPTAAEVAQHADVIILMLTGPEAIDAVLFGQDGAAPYLKDKIVINMSTVSPDYAKKLGDQLESQGIQCIDAPVSGSKKPAEDGTLVILAGGEEQLVKNLEPLFLTMGKKVILCGNVGDGSMMKMAINMLLGTMLTSLCEMVQYGIKGGLSKEALLAVVMNGPLSNMLFQLKEPMIQDELFPTQFPLKHMTKDLRFARETAEAIGADFSVTEAVLALFEQALEQGLGDEDFAAVFKTLA